MNTDFLHLLLIFGLFAAIVIMSISIIGTTLYTYRKTKKIKTDNTNKYYTAYLGKNTDITLVTFTSDSKFELMNAVYWASTNGLNMTRTMYLDLDTKFIYRPNYGNFDMIEDYDIEISKKSGTDLISSIRIRDIRRDATMVFEYVKKF